MASKRKYENGPETPVYSNKTRTRPSAEARVDPTYGQRSALPGLDGEINDDEELNYDEGMDALAYLRAVRQEATGIPNLLVAPRTPPPADGLQVYDDGVGDFRGRYEDGAYMAFDEASSSKGQSSTEKEVDDQLLYFDSILARYKKLREQMQQTPPMQVVKSLGPDHPTRVGKLNLRSARFWRHSMKVLDPKPAQIASMDKSCVLRLLRLLTGGTLLKRGLDVEIGVSRWAWSLLARLPDRGELNSEEIGIVRELGKKAVLLGMGLRLGKEGEAGMQEVEDGYEGEDLEEASGVVNEDEIALELDDDAIIATPNMDSASDVEATASSFSNNTTSEMAETDLAAAKARILGRLNDSTAADFNVNLEPEVEPALAESPPLEYSTPGYSRTNTKATVDMIITIAGEVYGQRDLLEFRGNWGIL